MVKTKNVWKFADKMFSMFFAVVFMWMGVFSSIGIFIVAYLSAELASTKLIWLLAFPAAMFYSLSIGIMLTCIGYEAFRDEL